MFLTYKTYSNTFLKIIQYRDTLSSPNKMPKLALHTKALKEHRSKLKEKASKYVPGTVNLQVLGSGAHGAPRALYVFTDQSRYLFNCGEGTQRLAHEHKMKLSKLEHVFVTHPTWLNMGGLPGVSLTLQDVGVPQITMHGPPGIDKIFDATRNFVVLRSLGIKIAPCNPETKFQDKVMNVQYIPIYNNAAKKWQSQSPSSRSPLASPDTLLGSDESSDGVEEIDYYSYWKKDSRSNSPENNHVSSSKRRRPNSPNGEQISNEGLPATSMSMAFVCHLHDRPGSLNLNACLEHGVTPGPLLGRLKSGEDVTLPNGKVVYSKDVTTPDEMGRVFLVVDCPNEDFLDNFIAEEAFKKHQSTTDNINEAAFLIVHFSPLDIMQNPKYLDWMDSFPPSTHHLVLNASNHCMGSIAVHRVQQKLNMISDDIFPLLDDLNDNCLLTASDQNDGITEMANKFSMIRGKTFTTIHLRPQHPLDSSTRLELQPEVYRQETLDVEGFPQALADLHREMASQPENGAKFPQVVFLGTGSCIPNKTRNTSGILVHLSETSCVILDCGEGTYGQIVRLYGVARTQQILRDLKAIYVSHLHADHHIGLVNLLIARQHVSEKLLFLLAPKQIRWWLKTYHQHFEPILANLNLVHNGDLLYTHPTLHNSLIPYLLEATGLKEVRTCFVRHCPNAFGVVISHADGWKLTYSGDTLPCDELIQLGRDSDLLIHEATMEDDLEEEARLKMHSTTSQAVHVGNQMRAKFTLLTHFSQRYARVPIFNDSFSSTVGIAFDNMQVRMGDLPKLPLMYPVLKLMFAEHYEEMELKAYKRQLNQERESKRTAS